MIRGHQGACWFQVSQRKSAPTLLAKRPSTIRESPTIRGLGPNAPKRLIRVQGLCACSTTANCPTFLVLNRLELVHTRIGKESGNRSVHPYSRSWTLSADSFHSTSHG